MPNATPSNKNAHTPSKFFPQEGTFKPELYFLDLLRTALYFFRMKLKTICVAIIVFVMQSGLALAAPESNGSSFNTASAAFSNISQGVLPGDDEFVVDIDPHTLALLNDHPQPRSKLSQCGSFLKVVLPLIRSQMSPAVLIESTAYAYIVYLLLSQSELLLNASEDLLNETSVCTSEFAQMSCNGLDMTSCKYLSELQQLIYDRYQTFSLSGVAYSQLKFSGTMTGLYFANFLLSLSNTDITGMIQPITAGLLAYAPTEFTMGYAITGHLALSSPTSATIPTGEFMNVPDGVLQSLSALTKKNSQILLTSGVALGSRVYRAYQRWKISR